MPRHKVAVVLFNLGGPDRPEAIGPFLLNLFSDPAILRVPFFVRPFLARTITRARLAPATANYALLGGKSPLLDLTRQQAAALEAALPEADVKCFIAMRYWHPFSLETAREVREWAPDQVVLLPLYPQYSTTTTGSSLLAWRQAAARVGLAAETTTVCCYPVDPAFAQATAALVKAGYDSARTALDPAVGLRVLFSSGAMLGQDSKRRILAHAPKVKVVDGLGSSESGTLARSVTDDPDAAATATFKLSPTARVIDEGMAKTALERLIHASCA